MVQQRQRKAQATVNRSIPRVGIYIRVSSEEQAREGYSLEFQEKNCLQWCEFRFGTGKFTHRVYSDEGKSGTLGIRPVGVKGAKYRESLTQLVRDIQDNNLDNVVIYRLDRLSRSPKLTHTLLEDVFLSHDVGLTSITEGFDASTKEGRMLVGMLASVAAYYLDCLAENVKEGIRTRFSKGEYATTPPYGWKWKEVQDPDGTLRRGDAIEVVPEEAKWVKQAAEWALAGWGGSRIAREFNRLGVPTRKGNQWKGSSILRMLHSPVHCGMIEMEGKLVDGIHAPMKIYDDETYEALHKAMTERTVLPGRTKGATHILLGGLIRCGVCGRRLRVWYDGYVTKHGMRACYYMCPGNERVGEGACGGITKSMPRVDDWVVTQVLKFAQSPKVLQLTREAAAKESSEDQGRVEQAAKQLRKRIASLDEAFERWSDALTSGAMTVDQFRLRNEKMLKEREEVQVDLEVAEQRLEAQSEHERQLSEVQKALKDLPAIWEQLEPEERKEILRLVVEELTLNKIARGQAAIRMQLRYGPVKEDIT